ncbi:hypothetical protein OF83DRAFT_631686 [Amylostereum chailletii]|nr:hypothetical protein OF83DRAFT_631686 [Amylostereum chailletii]
MSLLAPFHAPPAREYTRSNDDWQSEGGDKEVTRRLNRFVDSLVSLLVSEPKSQVFSGTFRLHSRSCTLYLAANGEVPQSVISRAKAIHDAIANLIDPSIPRDGSPILDLLSKPGVPTKTSEFLVEQYQYSMPKFRARLKKRYHVFKQFMDVLDAQPKHRDKFSKEEHDKIKDLKKYLNNVNVTLDIHKAEPTMLSEPANYISCAIHIVHEAWTKLCNAAAKNPYKDENLVNKIDKVYKDMKDSSVAGMPEGEFPFCRWLRKVTSLHVDARTVLAMAASERLRPWVECEFKVVAVPSSPRGFELDLSRSAIEKVVLWAHRPSTYKSSSEAARYLKDACDAISTFHLSPSAGPNPHCECSLVAFLQCHQIVTIPYIGVSKPSCLACHWYIQACNETLAHPSGKFQTAGCHGGYVAGWVPPSVGQQDQDLEIEKIMVTRLRSMFAGHLSTIETRNRTDSQSTAASSGSQDDSFPVSPSGGLTYNAPGFL